MSLPLGLGFDYNRRNVFSMDISGEIYGKLSTWNEMNYELIRIR